MTMENGNAKSIVGWASQPTKQTAGLHNTKDLINAVGVVGGLGSPPYGRLKYLFQAA